MGGKKREKIVIHRMTHEAMVNPLREEKEENIILTSVWKCEKDIFDAIALY